MQIKIQSTTLVPPSSPPFDHDHTLSLSHVDNDRNLHVNIRYLRVYTHTATSPSNPLHVITEALSKALVPYYPLTGTLRPSQQSSRLELFCAAGATVPLTHATADQTLASVDHLDSTDQWIEELVPDPSPNPDGSVSNPLVLQLTVFACGGFALGACVHHSMCDGVGATQFFAAMGEFARGAGRVSVEPVWDRAGLLGARNPPRVEMELDRILGLEKGFVPYSEEEGIVREWFEVRIELVEEFKGRLLEESGVRFSTFEALGAFIWRARVKGSKVSEDVNVKFAYSINIRKLLNPPLPQGYWGNGCVPMYAQTSAKDLVEQPLWKTAELIKKTKRNATDEYVRSFIDFQELHYAEGITAGKEVSGFTDWRHLGHSSVDFGWRGPVTVLPLSRNLLGSSNICFFLPYSAAKKEKKDGFKVLVSLPEMALPAFKVDMEIFSTTTQNLSSL